MVIVHEINFYTGVVSFVVGFVFFLLPHEKKVTLDFDHTSRRFQVSFLCFSERPPLVILFQKVAYR